MPAVGLAFMKTSMLIAATLVVALMVSLTIRLLNSAHEGVIQPDSGSLAPLRPAATAELDLPHAADREAVPETPQDPAREQATFELAFPPRLESEVGSLGIRVRRADGSPAEHLKIGIMPQDAADAFLMGRTVYTDSTGFVRVDQLAPGRVSVFYSRVGADEVEISAGQYTQIEKQAPLGVPFSGQVLSPEGRPVGGALIFVADSRGGDSLSEATVIADGAGHYEIRNVFDRSYVSARAPGFSPSIPIETGVLTGQPVELDLTLRGNPATLRGLVLSPTGLPVVGARIRIDLPVPDDRIDRGSGTDRRPGFPLAFILRTDSNGRFESDQVGSGAMKITARTATWQPWVETFELESGESREITIRFERGVHLTGSVLQENGEPIPEALVFVGRNAALDSFRVQTDEEGRFHIPGLPPGSSSFKIFHKDFEELETEVDLLSDSADEIQFTLHRLQSVDGVVVDETGAPLFRWLVAVESRIGLWSTSAWTDSDGRFELRGIPDGTTDLTVTNEDFWESATRLVLESVLPSQGPLRIVVPDSMNPRSSIRMQLRVDGKPAPIETQVRLRSASPLTHRDVHPGADGSVYLNKLASQDFHLEVALEGYATFHKSFPLAVSEDLDLGTLHIETGGRIHVQVEGPVSESEVICHVLDDRGRQLQSFDIRDGEGSSARLPAGTALLRYNPRNGATQFAEARVVTGETTVIRFVARPGTDREIRIARNNGLRVRFRTVASVTDAQGRIHFYCEDLQRQQEDQGTTTVRLSGLEPGIYRIQIRDPGGPVHESWLHVSTLDDPSEEAPPIQLDW